MEILKLHILDVQESNRGLSADQHARKLVTKIS